MKKPAPAEYDGPDYVRDNLLERDDFLSKALKLMATCIDSSLLLCAADKEAAAGVHEVVSSYWRTIPLADFFVLQNLKENIVAQVNSNSVLRTYFETLDLQFTMHLQSMNHPLTYEEISDKVMSLVKPTALVKDHTVFSEKIFMERKYEIDTARELVKLNSILLTVYMFRLAFPFSTNGLQG